ncbi:MAG: sortase [Actinomycetota bacterium]|nr:sortase [Actinomycetota bacterium]MDK1017386.1 sortase [Actinomycetota bacterium]
MVQHGAAGRIRQCRTCRTSYDQDPPFRDLDRLDNGDLIFVTDGSGFEVMHRVSDTFIVDPTDLWITYDTGASTLTMFACHPKGSERFRIMVRADLVAGRRIA